MKLWIIGNGFDLHHGLKTSYDDYKAFLCHRHRCKNEGKCCKLQSSEVLEAVCGNCCKCETNIYCPVRKFNELPRAGSVGNLWRNLEEACAIDLHRLMDRVKGEWHCGDCCSEDTASTALLNDELGFAKAFTGHEFYEWLRTVEEPLPMKNQKRLNVDEGDWFITFNYTTTLQRVYGVSDERICYVHGCLGSVDEELKKAPQEEGGISKNDIAHKYLIFGSPDITDGSVKIAVDYYKTLQKTSDEDADLLLDRLTELTRCLQKDVSDGLARIKQLVIKHCKNKPTLTEIVVAGHSLGKNDMPYLDYLAESFRYVKWCFLFYNCNDLKKALRFCEQHGLHGYYVPWDTADMDCVSCPADHRIPYIKDGDKKMETSIFNCPKCGKPIKVECPHCGATITTPQRPETTSAKADASGEVASAFLSYVKRMTKREFWTLKRSIIVGTSIVLLISIAGVVFLAGGDDDSSDSSHIWTASSAAETSDQGRDEQARDLAEECITTGKTTARSYNRVVYFFDEDEGFGVLSATDNPGDYAGSRMCFPTKESQDWWYATVVTSAEKLKNWILVSQKNKVRSVCKEITTILTVPSRRRWPRTGEWESPPLVIQGVTFTGIVYASNNRFDHYEVSLIAECAGYFRREIFNAVGTIEEIDREMRNFLAFVNPVSLEAIHKKQSSERSMFR